MVELDRYGLNCYENCVPTTSIDKRVAFRAAWKAFAGNWALLIAIEATLVVCWLVLEGIVISGEKMEFGRAYNIGVHLIYLIFVSGLEVGLMRIGLDVGSGKKPSYRTLFLHLRSGPAFLMGKFLYLLVVLGGLLLLVVPGLHWAARYAFFGFNMAETRQGMIPSFRRSARLTHTLRRQVLGFLVVLILFNLFAAIWMGAGLIASIPVSVLAMAGVFRQIGGMDGVTEGNQTA